MSRKIYAFVFLLSFVEYAFCQNILVNPGFENGEESWIDFSTNPEHTDLSIDYSVSHSGNASAKIYINDTLEVSAGWLQGVNIIAGHHYLLEGFIKTDNVQGMVFPYLHFSDQSDSLLYGMLLMPLNRTTNWKLTQSRFIAPENSVGLVLFLLFVGEKGTGWFDDLSLIDLTDTTAHQFSINFSETIGEIKPFLATNCGPVRPGNPNDLTSKFQEIGIDFVRTHDYYGPCDIHTIFPDTSRDPLDSTAYYFASTDSVIEPIINAGCNILFRLGESWEYEPIYNVPPADFEKWAQVCVQIIKHYNDGWNNGYHYNIEYWEIWNEPNLQHHWDGTVEQYCHLYHITANRIKEYNPSLKVGGPAIAYIYNASFIETFLDSVVTYNIPLDFFSYHFYNFANPFDYLYADSVMKKYLADAGLSYVERFNTEWNTYVYDEQNSIDWGRDDALNAALTVSAISYLQDSDLSKAFRYRTDEYLFGLFRDNGDYSYSGLALKAIGEFRKTSVRLYTTGGDSMGTTILAGKSQTDDKINLLISDNSSIANGYEFVVNGLLQDKIYKYQTYRIDNTMEWEFLQEGNITDAQNIIKCTGQSPFVDIISISQTSGIAEDNIKSIVNSIYLYPNPFCSKTSLEFRVQGSELKDLQLQIYDLAGRLVRTLPVTQSPNNTITKVTWDAKDDLGKSVSSGIYFYKLKVDDKFSQTKKLLLLR